MANTSNTPAVPRESAPVQTVTELRGNMADVLDDARVGYVTYVVRGSRQAAAIVPPSVGKAYEAGADIRRAARDELAREVRSAIAAVTDTLVELLDKIVDDPAVRQGVVDRMVARYQGVAARHHAQDDTTDDGTEPAESTPDDEETEAAGGGPE